MFVKKRRVRAFYLITLVLLISFFVEHFIFPFSFFVDATVSFFVFPVVFIQEKIVSPLKTFLEKRKNHKQIEKEFKQLNKKYEELIKENIQLRAMISYHNDISEILEFKKRYGFFDAIISQVLLRHFNHEEHFFLIDKGSRHGISKDMIAVYKNNLIGRISDVYPFYSKLILVTDRSCKVASYCTETKTFGIHVGINKVGKTSLQRVSHFSSVKEGDIVFSSGEGLVFPRGFALGTIETIKQNGLCFDIVVRPIIDLKEIEYCLLTRKV